MPKRKKCAYKGGKLGKKSYLSLGKTGRKNRIEVVIFFFKGKREITWDWNNWNFCSLLTHTHPPHPLSSWPHWLAPSGRHVGACFAAGGCCSTGWSHQKRCSQEMFCEGTKWAPNQGSAAAHSLHTIILLWQCCSFANVMFLVFHILRKTLLNTTGEVLPRTRTGALAQRQLNTPGCTCSHNYLLWLSLNKPSAEPINLTMASFF